MKKRIFTFLTLLVAFFGLIGLTTNNYKVINAAGNQTTVENDLAAITVPSTALISFPVTYKSVYGNDIDWTVQEGKENIIQYDEEAHWMVVNRPTEGDDEKVDITVTITGEGNATATKTFTVTVPVGKTVTKEYQISYELDGGTNNQNNPSSYHLGDATITLQAPTKEGYTFLGWYEGETKIEKIYVGSMQDYELTAQWTINTYTVTFNDYDGSLIKEETVSHGSAATAPADPSREGYTFTGWDVAFDSITSALTVTATYEINTYTVTFNDYDGSLIKEETVSHGSAATAPTDPSREGYTFKGWDVAFNSITSALTVTATYEINTYTVTFNDYDGSLIKEETVSHGSAATAPADPSREGYTFTGWDVAFNSITSALTVTATYEINKYKVTFTVDDEEVQSGEYEYNSEIQFPTEPTKEGATFTGWFLGETEYKEGATVPAQNITLVAGWSNKAQFTITFNTAGGNEIDSITVYDGSQVNAPAEPTKTGYTFAGWKNTEGEDVEFPYTPTGNVTLTAQWTINQYTITFNTDGGTAIAPITQDYGTAVTAPAYPTKEGYTFAGWDEEIPSTMPADDVTITAQWTINQYTITFNTVGGTEIAPITQDYGTAVTAPADPTKEGYTFAGWNEEIPSTMPAGNVTLTAQWTINTYTFTYIIEGVETEVKYEYAAQIEVPTAPSKDGYTFAGWNPEIPSTMPANDLTVAAVFTPNNMAEHIADEMEKVIAEELTETNLETELKEAIELVQGYDGGSVFFTSENAAISVDAEGNVTLIAPTNPTTVILTAIVSHEGETTTATYRYFTVQLTSVTYGSMTNNNVTVENVPTNAELTVGQVQSGNIQVEVEGQELAAAYDITLVSGDNNLNGEFTVRIPVPSGYEDAEKFYVYHVVEDQETLVATVTPVNGYIEFTTTHFSVYALYVDETPEIVAEELNEYYYEFTEKIISLSDENVILNDIEWNSINDGNDYNYDSTKGQKIGSGNNPAECWTLTTLNYFTNITKIIVHASGASSINGSISVKIGDNEGVCDSTSLTSSNTEYVFTFEGTEVGQITISMTQTSSKAFYMKSISINPSYAKVTYQANNDTDEVIISEVIKGSTITIPECKFPFDKHKFRNWKYSEEKVYSAGESLLVNEDITLIAQWDETVLITYAIDEFLTQRQEAEVVKDSQFTLINNTFTLSGYTFDGWCINGEVYAEGDAFTAETDMTFVASWKPSDSSTTSYFVKVTSAPTDWSGTYLIVYEAGKVAFDGSLETLDAVSNTKTVTISDNKIEATDGMKAIAFTIVQSENAYTIQSASGYYIGQTSDANGLKSNKTTTYNNTFSLNNDGTINIVSGNAYLRYNFATDQNRFRYYKSSSYTQQKAITLYKLSE